MPRRVSTHPLFFARLHLQLLGLSQALDCEIEYVGHHLADIESRFAESWDSLPTARDSSLLRYVTGHFIAVPALFVVEGRLVDGGAAVSIRNIRVVPLPG